MGADDLITVIQHYLSSTVTASIRLWHSHSAQWPGMAVPNRIPRSLRSEVVVNVAMVCRLAGTPAITLTRILVVVRAVEASAQH